MTKNIIISLFLAILFSFLLLSIKESLPLIYEYSMNIVVIISTVFIRLLKFTIVPIVILSLMNGIINLNSVKDLRIVGLKTLSMFFITTVIALLLSISISQLLSAGLDFGSAVSKDAVAVTTTNTPSFIDNIANMVPDNIIAPMLNNNMIQIIFIAVAFGIAILGASKDDKASLTNAVAQLEKLVIAVITMIMRLTPIGIFALITKSLATQGFLVLGAMIEYAGIMFLILFVHLLLVYLPLIKISGVNIIRFIKKSSTALSLAFSTTSSNAALPVTMKVAEEKLGIDKSIFSFVLPLGATIHMNATAIMQGLAVVFLSNIYGVEMTIIDYIGVGALAVIATVGAAGIPGTGIITLTMILVQYGIPVEGIAIIIGVDRLMEMFRTLINVGGDLVVALIVAKSENKLDLQEANS